MTRARVVLTSVDALVGSGLLPAEAAEPLRPVEDRYAVAITPEVAGLIAAGSKGVSAQFLPTPFELLSHPAEMSDPIGDNTHMPVPGIVHRHPDRVLLKIVNACPVYCRFCFRRETVGPGMDTHLVPDAIDTALGYIADQPGIWEVILTGGDPFIISPRRIANIVERVSQIPHIMVMRWHTRVPVVDPARVTRELVNTLRSARVAHGVTQIVALHANHSDEFTTNARDACRRLIDAGVTVVSQSVLLKGVNDDVGTLVDLMRTFVELGIMPYYLHHGDLAPGTAHFRVSIATGLSLVSELRRRLSGLCQPTYVLDLPGGFAKIPLTSRAVRRIGPGTYEIDDGFNRIHIYRDALSADAANNGDRANGDRA